MPTDSAALPPGTILAGYEVECELGRGSNGVVYRARQKALDRLIALKILLPELAAETEYVKSFLSEARLAAKLDHPNIVQAFDAGGTPEGNYFFAMELVRGCSVEEIRRSSPERLSFSFLYRLSIELADALQYAWQFHKMTHGDIKPGNLLIANDNGMLKLADLGLARIGGGGKIGEEIMATPLYVAPEVIRGDREDFGVKSDLYSFGIMLYELLCGVPPFSGKPEDVLLHHLNSEVPSLQERNPDLNRSLVEFVNRLISKDPAERPASWAEVRSFFSDLQNRGTIALTPDILPKKWQKETPVYSKHILPLLLTIAALGAAAFLVYLGITIARHWHSRPQTPELPPPVRTVQPEETAKLPPLSPPELSVAISSPASPAPPPTPPPPVQPVAKTEIEVKAQPAPEPVTVTPAATPEPEKVEAPIEEPKPQVEKPPVQPPPRVRQDDFNPRISEAKLQERSNETRRIVLRLGSNFSEDWKREAINVITASYRLQMQMELRGLKTKSIDRISVSSGGASWASNGPASGTLRVSPDTPAIDIAAQLGKGIFEANRNTFKMPSAMKDEFSDAFQYYIEQRMHRPAPRTGNRFLEYSNYSLSMFVQCLTNERELNQLRRLR